MAYVQPKLREILDPKIDELIGVITKWNFEGLWMEATAYAVTRLLFGVMRSLFGELRYWQIIAFMGILESVKIESFKRVASPWSNEKARVAGDVSEYRAYDRDLEPEEPEATEP